MNGQAPSATGSTTGSSSRRGWLSALLACGAVAGLFYIATDVFAANWWAGYSYTAQQVSELSAIGAPTRQFWVVVSTVYSSLMVAFGIGVWLSAGAKRSLKITGGLIALSGIIGELWVLFAPMHLRGAGFETTDAMHIVFAFVQVLTLLLFMAIGGFAVGGGFRWYSIATIVAMLAFGAWAGTSAPAIAAGLPTPWMGLVERGSVYAPMLWLVAFSVVRRRAYREQTAPATGAIAGETTPTKRVTVLMGSPQKGGATFTAARKFLDNLEAFGDVQGEIVTVSNYNIGVCRGCKVCFERGEEFCPLKDDRDVLIGKMMAADAVVFASPNYSWNVSGVMKVFLDRIAFLFHRPRFHGKTASAIVVQGIFRGREIRKYLEFVAGGLGFKVVKGSVIHTLEPMTEKAIQKMDKSLAEQSRRFHEQLLRPARPAPSLFALMMFRMGRTGLNAGVGQDSRDRAYYREQGWFESDYYYPTHLGPFKRAAGAFFDWVGARLPVFQVASEDEAAAPPSAPQPH